MATVLQFSRSLPLIVCDLAATRQRLASHYARTGEPTEAEDRDWSALEDRKAALEREFRDTFKALVGIDWALCEGVMS
jgi:hypothetical protein